MLLRRITPVLATGLVAASLLAVPATAVGVPDQEVPFPCGEEWLGSTRPDHRPSVWSIDFNRLSDLGRLVLSSAAGHVSQVGDAGTRGYGKWVKVEHAEGWSTVYAHLDAQWVVPGQYVDQGVPIGRVGATGNVTAPHLHYEQRLGPNVRPAVFHDTGFAYGSRTISQSCPDVPMSLDADGDGVDEVAVFRRGPGPARFEIRSADGTSRAVRMGRSSDLPVVGDWNGDGVTDVGVRRQASRTFLLRRSDGTVARTTMGLVRDVPVTGDWDGNGTTDVGVWRPGADRFRLLRADGTHQVIPFGGPGSVPVTGDWDGDGVTDVGVFDTAAGSYRLRTVASDGVVAVTSGGTGMVADLPVTGDWDGDGRTELGAWDPDSATFSLLLAPALTVGVATPTVRTIVFGRPR